MDLSRAEMPLLGPSVYPAQPASRTAAASVPAGKTRQASRLVQRAWCQPRFILFGAPHNPILDRVHSFTRTRSQCGGRVLELHFVVVNQRPSPALSLLVKQRGLESASRLLALERSDQLLGFVHSCIARVEIHEIL